MEIECKEKSCDNTEDVIKGASDDNDGEVEGGLGDKPLEEKAQEAQLQESHKKKDPITILSVEVMSAEVTKSQSGEQTSKNQIEKDLVVAPTNESQHISEVSTENVIDNIEVASADKSVASEIINDLVATQDDANEDSITNDTDIQPKVSNPLEENSTGDSSNVNTPDSSNLPILDPESSSTDTRAQQETIMDAVMNECDTLLDVADIPNDSCPVAESTNILNDSTPSIANIMQLEGNNNDDTNSVAHSATGLSLLAQYGSDNEDSNTDTESVIEVPTSSHDYRNKVVEIDSDSDTVSSSSDSDVEYLQNLRKKIEKRMDVDDDDDTEDENESVNSENKRKPKTRVKAKGELLLEDLPPIQDLQITVPEDECVELGKVHSIVDQLVLVSALPNSVLLDLETVLFLEKGRKVLGEVFDVLGQVADPLYCVRFNSNKQINEKNIKINDVVYVAPKTQYTQFIILSNLMTIRGSDASWENDLEPPPKFLDYSDDEQEQLARRQTRNRNRPNDNEDPEKRARIESEGSQSSSNNRPQQSTQQHRPQRYPHPREGHGPNNQNSYGRPSSRNTYNQSHNHNQQQSPINHHPSSWHSNYYPQPYAGPPPNYGYGGYTPMPVQNYHQGRPMYPMPQMQPMPYPPQQHLRHPPPPMNNAPGQPHAFSMRPPTMPGMHFDSSPPPPGAQ